jgi:hypothetical protein|tara:strand:+ start:132 stop:305 length:174 start_codon:yes stop_codon:yes gene_type:complete
MKVLDRLRFGMANDKALPKFFRDKVRMLASRKWTEEEAAALEQSLIKEADRLRTDRL